jgi:hypothetical protein
VKGYLYDVEVGSAADLFSFEVSLVGNDPDGCHIEQHEHNGEDEVD